MFSCLKIPLAFVFLSTFLLMGCSQKNDPGRLAGDWHLTGIIDIDLVFREGETEANGIIERVAYAHEDNAVLVTYLEGMAKGRTMRYTFQEDGSAVSITGKLTRN